MQSLSAQPHVIESQVKFISLQNVPGASQQNKIAAMS